MNFPEAQRDDEEVEYAHETADLAHLDGNEDGLQSWMRSSHAATNLQVASSWKITARIAMVKE